MIIKSSRVRTRGSALKKLIAHVENADDNDEIVVLRGTTADLLDAREDARSFGREYCVRHWIVSPSREATFEKMLEAVDALAAEFGFDPARVFARGHRKPKATAIETLFDGHLHILVPEVVDPVTGRILSSSNDWLRGEKVGKILSHDWGEPFVESAKPTAILAALKRDGRGDVAAAYQAAFPEGGPRPVASFDAASQQRLKRKGLDLPALRVLVAGAFNRAASRTEFEANLLAHGLVCKVGEKPGVYMVEAMDGEQIGSLARLAKVKKAALLKKMEISDAGPAEEAHHGGGHFSQHSDAAETVGAHQIAGGGCAGNASAEPAWDDVGHDEPVAGIGSTDDREAGQDHRTVGSAVDREGRERHAERLSAARDFQFTFGLAPHAQRLQTMLGTANRIALPPEERVVLELGEIEDEARHAKAMIDTPPPEPSTLIAARTALATVERQVQELQKKLDQASACVEQLKQHPPWWRRAIGLFTGGNARRASEVRAAGLHQRRAQAVLAAAKTEKSNADNLLRRGILSHQSSVREHVEKWTRLAKAAEARAADAARAHELLLRSPGAAALGAAGLCTIAAKLTPRRRERRLDAENPGEHGLAAQP